MNNSYSAGRRTPTRLRSLARAVSAIVAAGGPTVVAAQNQSGALEEVIVTARKREENLQDIPQSIQAFTAADIERYGIRGVQDYARFIPAMSYVSTSPGQTKLVFRGIADSAAPYIADPTVGMYLDEQPLTTYSQTPEVRAVDIERIEALSGPQGTLYGASSQSGTLRLITNKPNTEAFAAQINAGVNTIEHGGTGFEYDAMVNVPINDRLAVRLVGFHARDAGWIDNVLGQSWDRAPDRSPIRGPSTNAEFVDNNVNSIDWYGGRASVRWHVTDDWTVTGIYSHQQSAADGWNDYDPTLPGISTVKFNPEFRDDVWHALSLTIEGDLGFAQLISATSYFSRSIQYEFDSTVYQAYLNYDGTTYDFGPEPSGKSRLKQRDRRWTQEVRLSHEGSRWDWTLGLFYQYSDEKWDNNIFHRDYRNSDGFAAWQAYYGPLAPTDIAWHSNEANSREDIAVFGEVTFRLTDKLDLIFGGRYYDVTTDRVYTLWQPSSRPAYQLDLTGPDDGFLPKAAIQYSFDDDKMIYALYSEGYRTGGINRSRGQPTLPQQYDSDLLKNYEAGIKTQWLDGRLQINLTGYHMVWQDFQLEVTDPSVNLPPPDNQPFQTMVANLGDAVADGLDFDVSAVLIPGMDVGVNGTWLIRNETDEPFTVTDPRLPGEPTLDLPKGTRLPLSAFFSASAYLDYTWPVQQLGGDMFFRFQYSYEGHSVNYLVPDNSEPFPRLRQDAYHIADAKFGLMRETWDVELYVNNLWDERPELWRDNDGERFWGGDRSVTSTPRTLGLRFRKYFK